MGILDRIFGRIRDNAGPASAQAAQPARPAATAQAPAATPAQVQPQPATQPAAAQPSAGSAQAVAEPPTIERVDMEKVLDDMAAKHPQKLNWRNSVVDLMKLTGMESTLQERRELADEMGYTGDKSDSAAMNIWLHKKLMERLKA